MTSAAETATLRELCCEPATRPPSLWEFVRESGLQSLVACASKNPNAKFTVLLVSPASGRTVLAIKVPTTEAAARAVEAEAQMLVGIHRLAPPIIETVPRMVEAIEFDGLRGIAMTAVHGTPMTTSYLRGKHTATPADVAADFAAVGSWLAALQHGTAGDALPVEMDAGVTGHLTRRFSEFAGLNDDLGRLAEIHGRLGESSLPRTAVHGDLWLGNVLASGARASGVVDWEGGGLVGEPLRDLARFAHMYALFLDRRTRPGRQVRGHPGLRADEWGAGVAYALDGTGWFPEVFRRFLRDGLSRLGGSPESWRDVALAGIAEVAALADDDEFARRHLILFRRLAQRHPRIGSSAATARIRGLRDSSGGAGCR